MVDFKDVAKKAERHAYMLIYQNTFTDDKYDTVKKKLQFAMETGQYENDQSEGVVTDEEIEEDEFSDVSSFRYS